MTKEEFFKVQHELLAYAEEVASSKRVEYTGADVDVLMNFKRIAQRMGLTPLHVWGIYFNKHVDSVNTYIKTDESNISEPMPSRFADMVNYLFLGMALIIEAEGPKELQRLIQREGL